MVQRGISSGAVINKYVFQVRDHERDDCGSTTLINFGLQDWMREFSQERLQNTSLQPTSDVIFTSISELKRDIRTLALTQKLSREAQSATLSEKI